MLKKAWLPLAVIASLSFSQASFAQQCKSDKDCKAGEV